MSPVVKHTLRLALLCTAVAVLMPAPAFASSASSAKKVPCWVTLLNDWYDGTINNIYPINCYTEAIKHLPPDVRIYGSAKDDILAARAAAINKQHAPPEHHTTTTEVTTTGTNGQTTTTTETTTTVAAPTTIHRKRTGIVGLLHDLTPGDPQAFPLPLLVLGALAILLVLAGAAGMLWQRSHPRGAEPPPA